MTIYLYVKQHRQTGLKYFGKTERDVFSYKGSGKYWRRHLKTHGNDIDTTDVWTFENEADCTAFALEFSTTNNIVESEEWANLRDENGIDGNPKGIVITKEQIAKRVETRKGYKHTDETKAKISNKLKQLINGSEDHLARLSQQAIKRNTGRKHSAETKAKISAKRIGKPLSEETRRKMSASRQAYLQRQAS